MAGRFRQANVAWHHGFQHLGAHHSPDIGADLIGKPVAAIDHCQHDAKQFEAAIESGFHPFDRTEQLAEPFQCKELALEWHQHGVCSDQRIDGDEAQRRRAIDDHEILWRQAGQRIGEAVGAAVGIDQLHLCASQGGIGRQDRQARNGRLA